MDGGLWWHEEACWELTAAEVDRLDDATSELHRLCLEAVDHLVRREPGLMREWFALPDWFADYAARSWTRGDPSLMGRMDLAVDEAGAVKLLEYNADTPTLAIETAVAQWFWLQDTHPDADQFNSLHERLLERLAQLRPRMDGAPLHFAAFREAEEEWRHATYFRDLAGQAGIPTEQLDLADIGWDGARFLDQAGQPIRFLHKLYPWEWVRTDEFGPHLARDTCAVLEPPWKALLSDKAILAVLWRLFPDHPNLLPAFPGRLGRDGGEWVEKPCLGREGANVRILREGRISAETGGSYGGDGRWVSQALARLPQQDGWTAVIGSWVVGDAASGIVFREGRAPILRDTSRVVPHLFR